MQEYELDGLFQITGFPTIAFFTDGKYYKWQGETLPSTRDLIDFVYGGYASAEGHPLPDVSSLTFFNIIYHVKRMLRNISIGVVGAIILGIIGGIAYFCCFGKSKTRGKSGLKGLFSGKASRNMEWDPALEERATVTSITADVDDAEFVRPELA